MGKEMVRQHKSWDDILLEEREENSRLRQQQRDQAERERRLAERLTQLKEQQSALQQGKTVDAVGRDGKIKALQVCTCALCLLPGVWRRSCAATCRAHACLFPGGGMMGEGRGRACRPRPWAQAAAQHRPVAADCESLALLCALWHVRRINSRT